MAEKKEYRITFRAVETVFYRTDVLAESPEEAMKIFESDPDDNIADERSAWDEYEWGGREELNQIECEGFWDDQGHFTYFEPVIPSSIKQSAYS